MAEKRKLLVEIEKCFKKVDEGFEIFDEIMSKVSEANSENQREKFQDDLKKEIKKLQRLRDQIKGWQSSSEIKDKERLNQYRRLIEQRMETFKDIERENKTKPHSKQGLSAEDKLDPKEKEKGDAIDWVNNQIRQIQDEIDRTESKIEALGATEGGKKKGKDAAKKGDKEKAEELKKHLERVKFHLRNLEIVLRLFTNEQLDIKDALNKLKEPVEMYIEALDPENDDDPESMDPEDLYEELNLSSYVHQLSGIMGSMDEGQEGGVKTSPTCGSPTSLGAPKEDESSSKQRHQSGGEQLGKASAKQLPATTPLKLTRLISQTSAENPLSTALSSPSTAPIPSTPCATPVLPYAVAAGKHQQHASMAKTSSLGAATTNPSQNTSSANSGQPAASPPLSAPVPLHSPVAGGGARSLAEMGPFTAGSSVQTPTPVHPPQPSPVQSSSSDKELPELQQATQAYQPHSDASLVESPIGMRLPSPVSSLTAKNSDLASVTLPSSMPGPTASAGHSSPTATSSAAAAAVATTTFQPTAPSMSSSSTAQTSIPNLNSLRQALQLNNEGSTQPKSTTIPPWLGASPLGMVPVTKLLQDSIMQLEAALGRIPSQMDSERPRNYLPKLPCPTPNYYPQMPLQNADTLDYYLRLSPETLFFTFYYMEGSKAQLLAAKALKKLSWRFHTKYMMWFQRHEEPKLITDDYEQGTYVYFNFEKWQQQKKEQFIFEYKYLEDREGM